MTARVRNFLTRLVVGAYMPRSIKVVLTVIGFVVATTVLGTIEQVTGCLGLSQACPPPDDCVPCDSALVPVR